MSGGTCVRCRRYAEYLYDVHGDSDNALNNVFCSGCVADGRHAALSCLQPETKSFAGINRTPPARPVKVGDSMRYGGVVARGVTALRRHAPQAPVFVVFGEVSFRIDDPVLLHADGAPIDAAATLAALKSAEPAGSPKRENFVPNRLAQQFDYEAAQYAGVNRDYDAFSVRFAKQVIEHAKLLPLQAAAAADGQCPGTQSGLAGGNSASADLDAARKRIDARSGEVALVAEMTLHMHRANRPSDQAGALANEKRELLVENAMLRRELEQAKRKVRR